MPSLPAPPSARQPPPLPSRAACGLAPNSGPILGAFEGLNPPQLPTATCFPINMGQRWRQGSCPVHDLTCCSFLFSWWGPYTGVKIVSSGEEWWQIQGGKDVTQPLSDVSAPQPLLSAGALTPIQAAPESFSRSKSKPSSEIREHLPT